ncbi:hypothetical protein TSUD_90430 [Trifolium subterraneum]|uniref:Putative plant transposon protein domain-containing protein n=1 Tax=Trifolium subterraneum TaxID=3900 RepID=A0A2Z6LL10_TRISU|nr:hypothetical protein TSUD_90430 [Trifolium subterraneum]
MVRTKKTTRRAPPFHNPSPIRPNFRQNTPSDELLNIPALRTIFPPNFQQQTPNQNQTPPHLKPKMKKMKPSTSLPTHRSQRIIAGIKNQKTQSNERIYITCETTNEEPVNEVHDRSFSSPNSDSSKTISNQNPSSSSEQTPSPKASKSNADKKVKEKGKEKVTEVQTKVSEPKKKVSQTRIRSINAFIRDKIPLFEKKEEKKFRNKWRTRPVAAGRVFNFQAHEKQDLDLKSFTDYQGWSSFLQIKETYYPRLVQAFYFKAKFDSESNSIRSVVKGKEIVLTADFIGTLFKLPTDGFKFFGKEWYSQAGVTIEDVREPLFYPGTPLDHYKTSNLKLLQIFFNIMSKGNIMPRQGKYDALGDNDLMVIYHLFEKKRLSLPHIIINFMMEVAKSNNKKLCVSYGMILTRVFKHFEVSFKNEISETKCKNFDLKNLKHFKPDHISSVPLRTYSRNKRKRDEQQDVQDTAQSEPSNPPIIETNEAFVVNQPIQSQIFEPSIHNSPIIEDEPYQSPPTSPLVGPRAELNLNIPPSSSQDFPQSVPPTVLSPNTESPQVVPQLGATQATTQLDPNSVLEPLLSESTIAPLFSSPPNFNFSPLFNDNLQSNFFNSTSQNMFHQPFFNDILNSPPATFIPTMPAMSSMNDAGPSNPQPQPMPTLPRSKTERIKRDIKKLFQGQQLIDNHLSYITMENSIMRDWFRSVVCYLYNLPYPEINPYPPPVHMMPQPSPSSSSGDSTPTNKDL